MIASSWDLVSLYDFALATENVPLGVFSIQVLVSTFNIFIRVSQCEVRCCLSWRHCAEWRRGSGNWGVHIVKFASTLINVALNTVLQLPALACIAMHSKICEQLWTFSDILLLSSFNTGPVFCLPSSCLLHEHWEKCLLLSNVCPGISTADPLSEKRLKVFETCALPAHAYVLVVRYLYLCRSAVDVSWDFPYEEIVWKDSCWLSSVFWQMQHLWSPSSSQLFAFYKRAWL